MSGESSKAESPKAVSLKAASFKAESSKAASSPEKKKKTKVESLLSSSLPAPKHRTGNFLAGDYNDSNRPKKFRKADEGKMPLSVYHSFASLNIFQPKNQVLQTRRSSSTACISEQIRRCIEVVYIYIHGRDLISSMQ